MTVLKIAMFALLVVGFGCLGATDSIARDQPDCFNQCEEPHNCARSSNYSSCERARQQRVQHCVRQCQVQYYSPKCYGSSCQRIMR